MTGRTTAQLLVVVAVVLGAVVGAGSAAVTSSHDDGNRANGEELRSAEDDEKQLYPINYSFYPSTRTPGHTDGRAEHYAEGLTENVILHYIVVSSKDFGFSNCEPSNTKAFGVDRGNNDSGTKTDESLLTSYKRYNSGPDAIRIAYYKKEGLAGSPIKITVDDQIVAAQSNCYDNPEEKGWYRITGRINGSSNGNTKTDYAIVDLTQWVYICNCDSRQEARQKLGPPPGSDGGGGGATPTPTATPAPDGKSTPTDASGQQTPSPTDAPKQNTASPTASPQGSQNGGGGGGGGNDGGGDARNPSGGGTDGGGGGQPTASATGAGGGTNPATPTVSGPGFGAVAALAALAFALLARRR